MVWYFQLEFFFNFLIYFPNIDTVKKSYVKISILSTSQLDVFVSNYHISYYFIKQKKFCCMIYPRNFYLGFFFDFIFYKANIKLLTLFTSDNHFYIFILLFLDRETFVHNQVKVFTLYFHCYYSFIKTTSDNKDNIIVFCD